MSADLNTGVTLFGTAEELAAMLLAIKSFEKDSYDEYKKSNYGGGYIISSEITSLRGEKRLALSEMTQDAISKFVKKQDSVRVDISGPWGHFSEPYEVPLFERIADAAPAAAFQGWTSGFMTGQSVSTNAEMKNGKLLIKASVSFESEWGIDGEFDAYQNYLYENLSYEEFCGMFKLNPAVFGEDEFFEFVNQSMTYGDFTTETTQEEFLEMLNTEEKLEIDEKTYADGIKAFADKKLTPFEEFDEDTSEKTVIEYDPVTKEYTVIEDWRAKYQDLD